MLYSASLEQFLSNHWGKRTLHQNMVCILLPLMHALQYDEFTTIHFDNKATTEEILSCFARQMKQFTLPDASLLQLKDERICCGPNICSVFFLMRLTVQLPPG